MGKEKRDRKKEYAEHPENFVPLDELVMAVRVNEEKVETFINPSHGNLFARAIGELTLEVPFVRQFCKQQHAQQNQSAIIQPGGNGGVNRVEGI